MSANRIRLRGVSLADVPGGLPVASLRFEPGLNVVSGASNTGKTYAVDCIDFMLGKEPPLREIQEASGYRYALLGIETGTGDISLRRPLAGGKFSVLAAPLERAPDSAASAILSEKHSPNKSNNISHFLLSLCGMSGLHVAKTSTKPRSLSFRDVAHFVLIREEAIFKRNSLFLHGQHSEQVTDAAVFRLLLCGLGAAADGRYREDSKSAKLRLKGQIEVLDELIAQAQAEFAASHATDNVHDEIAAIDAKIQEESSSEAIARSELAALELRRQDLWRRRDGGRVRAQNVDALLSRFAVLHEQYRSDLLRLDAIVEGGNLFARLPRQRCQFCGAAPEVQDDCEQEASIEKVRGAAAHEAEKLRVRITELEGTITYLRAELARENEGVSSTEAELAEVGSRLEQAYRPKLREVLDRLRSLHERRSTLERVGLARLRLDGLRSMRDRCSAAATPGISLKRSLGEAPEIRQLCDQMRRLLLAWSFPGNCHVTFEESEDEFRISGKLRSSYGKGLRAITHAAFSIGLMLHARERELAHPGFVVLDSPLVTYSKRDVPPGEEILDNMKDAFFSSLAGTMPSDVQVIVFENERPPSSIRHERFTGTPDYGRSGFIPSRP